LVVAVAAATPTMPRKTAATQPPSVVHQKTALEEEFSGRYLAYSAGKFSHDIGTPAMKMIRARSHVPANVSAASGAAAWDGPALGIT
jgi:hypothetical protein